MCYTYYVDEQHLIPLLIMTITAYDIIEDLKPTLLGLAKSEGNETGCSEDRLKQLIAEAVSKFEVTELEAEMLRYVTYKKLTQKAEEARQLSPEEQNAILSQEELKQEFNNVELSYAGFILNCNEKHKQHIEKRYSNFLDEEPDNADIGECCFHNFGDGGDGVIDIIVGDIKNCVITLDFTEFYGDDEDGAGSKNDWFVTLKYENGKLVDTNYDKVFVG